jgi:anti-sigma regulatory factor (Ser/Thr protein kinase)
MDVEPSGTVRYVLDGHVSCVAEARHHVRAFLALDPLVDPAAIDIAQLAASELVANAVQHAPGPCTLELSDDGPRLYIGVSDSSTKPPADRDTDVYAGHGGAGLRLLRALAGDVEVDIRATGKTVSVTIDKALREPAP